MQSCGCIPSMINYNLCEREGGKERKNKVQLIKAKKLRKKERKNYNLIKARGGERERERNQERSRSKWRERER